MRMFREESTARSRREYSGEVVTRQSMDRAAAVTRLFSNTTPRNLIPRSSLGEFRWCLALM